MRKLSHTLPFFVAGAIACGPSGPSAQHFRGKEIGGLSDTVLAVAIGPKGGLWIGTANGIVRKKGSETMAWWKGWRVTAAVTAGPDAAYFGVETPTKVMQTGKMGPTEARVYKLQDRGTNLREIPLGEPIIGDRIDALHVDRAGNLWVAARDSGVLRVTKGTEELQPHIPFKDLGHERATSFAEAPDGTMYIGTFGAGLTVWKDGKSLQHFTPQNSPLRGNGVVRSIAYHPQLGLFAATANKMGPALAAGVDPRTQGMGVSRMSGAGWQPLTAGVTGLKSNDVIKIAISPQGDVWFLTSDHGASVLRGGTQWVHPPSAGRMAFDVAFSPDGAWLATGGGLSSISL